MVVSTLVLAAVLVPLAARGATTPPATTGLPLYQFAETGVEPLPWNATSLESYLNSTTMLGGPHGATGATEGVLAYRTNQDHLAQLTLSDNGATQWLDYTPQNDVPSPGADPIPFFDPSGNVDVLYVDKTGNVILVTPNDPDTTLWSRLHYDTPWRPYVSTDLSALTGVTAVPGLPSVQVVGTTGTVAYRTTTGAVEVLTLTWSPTQPVPVYAQSDATVTTYGVTSTTQPAAKTSPHQTTNGFASDPVVLPGLTPTFASTLPSGDLVVFTSSGPTITSWTYQDLTTLTGQPEVVGPLAIGASSTDVDLAALTSSGVVELFTTPYPAANVWNEVNVTALATGAPPLAGALSLQVTPTQVAIAGQAANWGDLFVLTNPTGSTAWTSTDVSVTAGSAARTVGKIVTGLQVSGQLTLYAAGVSSPPPQGVGVYAIPSAKWTKAISDGWPIISETGGLGTRSAPWVGFTSTTDVADSPDYLMGQAIYNAHKRVTWLSFWTVSGPLAGQPVTTANFYSHGMAAGVWVATQIDSYRTLGVGLKPDWVILDPEGYPDDHSGLDAPGGASPATLAKYATYWAAMMQGWQAGVASVDPSLDAGVYASQSEYRNYQLANLNMPVFVAVAFSGGGPIPVAGATGANVRGFISFGAACTPASTLQSEATTLLNPPWGGQFNTLQFNAGVYCAPPAT